MEKNMKAIPQAHLEPSPTSTMELFSENIQRVKATNCFGKNCAPLQVLDWVLIRPL